MNNANITNVCYLLYRYIFLQKYVLFTTRCTFKTRKNPPLLLSVLPFLHVFTTFPRQKYSFPKSPKFTQAVLFIVTVQEEKSNTVVLLGDQITVDGSEIWVTTYWSPYRWFPVFASKLSMSSLPVGFCGLSLEGWC